MRMTFEDEESGTRWKSFSGGIWRWGTHLGAGGAFIAEQVRNYEVRSERQLGLWGLGDGTPGWYFLRDPGLVLSPRCASVSSLGLN